jgi:hypothetical protein
VPNQPDNLIISDHFAFPNPASGGIVTIRFNATRPFSKMKITGYSAAFRRIKESVLNVNRSVGINTMPLEMGSMPKAANGAYYYVLTLEDNAGRHARSTAGILLILK